MRATFNLIMQFLRRFKHKKAPFSEEEGDFSKTRHLETPQTRHLKEENSDIGNVSTQNSKPLTRTISVRYPSSEPLNKVAAQSREDSLTCPYCNSKDTIKKGVRKKKYEGQQRFICNACARYFVAPRAKGKSFPLKIILEAISYYNTGFTLAESCRFLKEKSGLDVKEAADVARKRA